MPQSLARFQVHLIFSTKNREQVLHDRIRPALHAYMAVVLQKLECPPTLINSMEHHVHSLFELARTVSVSQAVEEVKKSSSMRTNVSITVERHFKRNTRAFLEKHHVAYDEPIFGTEIVPLFV